MEEEYEEMRILTRAEYTFYDDTIDDNITDTKKENIIQTNNKRKKMMHLNPNYIKYELFLEKDENDQLLITINEKNYSSIIKYQKIFNIEDLINLSPYFKLLNVINPSIFFIDSIYSFLKAKLDRNFTASIMFICQKEKKFTPP